MDRKKKVNSKIIIISAVVLILAVIGIIFLLLHNGKDSYRLIKIFSLEGSAVIKREAIGEIDAYKNMLLESGDIVSLNEGTMTLKLDEDKYIYVEEQTEFELQAAGSSKNSKTKIKLNKGTITNELQSKLNGESSYEINTQNSTMSVRGTMYRVELYTDEKGILYTKVTVFEGSVAIRLVYPDGTIADDETLIDRGKEVIIYEDASTTDYLTGVRDIVYSELPDSVIRLLQEKGIDIEAGQETASGSDAKTDESTKEGATLTVTFLYNGTVFGTQQVNKGECATRPILMPAASGSWDFDFTTPITEDTKIEWK